MNDLTIEEENQIEADIEKILFSVSLGELEEMHGKIEMDGLLYYLENYDTVLERNEISKQYLNNKKFYITYCFFNELIDKLNKYFN